MARLPEQRQLIATWTNKALYELQCTYLFLHRNEMKLKTRITVSGRSNQIA